MYKAIQLQSSHLKVVHFWTEILVHFSTEIYIFRFIDLLYQKNWVVNIQKPFGKPEKILEYLSRYVFRIAITDRRIIEVKNGKVRFSWKDYRTGRHR